MLNVKKIMIGEQEVTFSASAALPINYRNLTGRDFFKDFQEMNTGGNINDKILSFAYVMYREANPEGIADEAEWLSQFNFADFFAEDVLAKITVMLVETQKSTSVAKKKGVR